MVLMSRSGACCGEGLLFLSTLACRAVRSCSRFGFIQGSRLSEHPPHQGLHHFTAQLCPCSAQQPTLSDSGF